MKKYSREGGHLKKYAREGGHLQKYGREGTHLAERVVIWKNMVLWSLCSDEHNDQRGLGQPVLRNLLGSQDGWATLA